MSWECERASITIHVSGVYEHDEISDEERIFVSFGKNEKCSLSFVIISSPEKAIKMAEDDMHER